jgi:hypothetical protein
MGAFGVTCYSLNLLLMYNSDLINIRGREKLFTDLWLRALDVRDGLPGDIGHLRLAVVTGSGHNLLDLPLEAGDSIFLERVLTDIASICRSKAMVAAIRQNLRDDSTGKGG